VYSKLAQALSRHRNQAAAILAKPLAQWSKFAASAESLGADAFAREETGPLVDFLIRYFETPDPTWRHLYIGERLKELHLPTDNVEQTQARRREVLIDDRSGLCELIGAELDAASLEPLDRLLSEALNLATATTREVHVLFVGDCLFLQLSTFCSAALLEEGITLRPIFATSRNPFELHSSLQNLEPTAFDLVCFSPYTYTFSVLLSQTSHLQSLGYSRRKLRNLAQSAGEQTARTMELLATRFECPVVVNKTANIRPFDESWRSYTTSIVTRLVRKTAANIANAALQQVIVEHNKFATRPLIAVDERPLASQYGEQALAKKLYDTNMFHPTVLSMHLAKLYVSLIAGVKYLAGKKVIVTDLDNTLWKGLIGEGPIEHEHARQQILKQLRRKGIVLAVASKNDPASVRWDGALLDGSDFVVTQINWENKALNLKRIATKLNLNLGDFVFVDDRDDELEMVRLALPEVHTLSAKSDRTWQMLEWWAASLPEQGKMDRTQLYRERAERQSYLAAEVIADQDRLLASLNLKLDIREATSSDVLRVVELVNRTHQFNTNPQHISAQQVVAWLGSPEHRIIVGEARDKFGAMGLISAMIVESGAAALNIHLWVLSCRVFGYGIETAMLNHLKHIARSLNRSIQGPLVATAQNGPCREIYPKNGFSWDGSTWVFAGGSKVPNPSWLTVNEA